MGSPSEARPVFVLGAGFSKAFARNAPLGIHDYGIKRLRSKVARLKRARDLLDAEVEREHGRINVERLLTRLDSNAPFDAADAREAERRVLREHLVDELLGAVRGIRLDTGAGDLLQQFATRVTAQRITLITFNYDDLLDNALEQVPSTGGFPPWDPWTGYGFSCMSAYGLIRPGDGEYCVFPADRSPFCLLKLHGSLTWRRQRGMIPQPGGDSVVHWTRLERSRREDKETALVEGLVEPREVVVPPILNKTALAEWPVLQVVWDLALQELRNATEVTFLGYSMPATDVAAQWLFGEALRRPTRSIDPVNIRVVAWTKPDDAFASLRERYCDVLPEMRNQNRFEKMDARDWVTNYLAKYGAAPPGPARSASRRSRRGAGGPGRSRRPGRAGGSRRR